MKVKVELTITNTITSNNFCKPLIDLMVGYYPQGRILSASPIRTSIMQHWQNLQTAPSVSFHLPACSTFSWLGMFFIYTCVISHKFLLTSLRKPCFFPWFLTRNPLLLLVSQLRSKGCFILRQMTLRLMLVYSFISFVIPILANHIRHSRDDC